MNEILKNDDAVGRPLGPVLPFEHRTSQVPTGAYAVRIVRTRRHRSQILISISSQTSVFSFCAPSSGPMAYATEQTPLEPV